MNDLSYAEATLISGLEVRISRISTRDRLVIGEILGPMTQYQSDLLAVKSIINALLLLESYREQCKFVENRVTTKVTWKEGDSIGEKTEEKQA